MLSLKNQSLLAALFYQVFSFPLRSSALIVYEKLPSQKKQQ